MRVSGRKIAVPASAPRKMVSSTPCQPTKAPTIAIILMSPPPIASSLNTQVPRVPTSQRMPKPLAAPSTASRSEWTPPTALSTRPMASPPQVNSSGMMYLRASVSAMPMSSVPKSAPLSASTPRPLRAAIQPQSAATASSTAGYIGLIGSRQWRHFPRSRSQEKIGMLSRQAMAAPQRGQLERGRTTDCFGSAPQRRMQTLRKLPMTAPKSAPTRPGASVSLTRHLVEQNGRGGGHVQRLGPGAERNPGPAGGQPCESRPDPGALVPDDQRKRDAVAPVERGAVRGGKEHPHLPFPRPVPQGLVLHGDERHPEAGAHGGAQGLRVGELRRARQREHARGAQRKCRAHHGADVAGILHAVEHQHRRPRPRVDVLEPPPRRLHHREDALGMVGRRQLAED